MAWGRGAAFAAVLCAAAAAAAAQVSRQPDPASCRHYVTQPGGELTACPDGLLFDAPSLSCLPAAEASCSQPQFDAVTEQPPPIVRKCCPESQQFNLSQGQCVERPAQLSLPIYSLDPVDVDNLQLVTGDFRYTLLANKLDCSSTFLVNNQASEAEPIFILDNGNLYVPGFRLIYTLAVYCVETFVSDVDSTPRLGAALCGQTAPSEVISVEDTRIKVQRCCARDVPYDPERGCLIHKMLHGNEVPPPLDLADSDIRQELAAATIDEVFRFSRGNISCNDSLMMLGIGEKSFVLGLDGTLTTRNVNVSLAAGEFCVNERLAGFSDEAGNATTAVALFCPTSLSAETSALLSAPAAPPPCRGQLCLHKCCPPGYEVLLTEGAGGAQQMTCVFTWRELNVSASAPVPPALYELPFVYGQPPCQGGLFEVTEGNFSLKDDGSFRLAQYDEYACNFTSIYVANSSTYCIDTKRGSDRPVHAFFCYDGIVEDDSNAAVNIFFPILMGITDFFLLVTIIVYLTVPDPTQISLNKKRKLSQSVLGMILLAYISSLFFGYLVLIVVQTATGVLSLYRTACKVLAVILYFFLLAAFFWLSVICFEIYLTTRADKRTSGRRRFRLYAVYAWCCPLAMATLALIMDLVPGIDNCSVIKPAFGRYRCLFQNRKAYVAYFYAPVGVLLLACMVLYALTVRNLSVPAKLPGREDSVAMSEQSAKQQRKRRMLCVKLFFIMGITWVAELLSYLIGGGVFWYFFDVINILQGFFIFVAFILRPKVLQYIKRTAQQALSRSFGHDSQQDGGGGGGGQHRTPRAAADVSVTPKFAGGQPHPSPMTNSTRLTSIKAAP